MADCEFPLCKRFARKDGMCVNHSMYAKLIIEKELVKGIAKKSAKATVNHKEYKKIVVEMLLKSKKCEINSPVCSKVAQGLHHMKKRGEFLMDKRFLKRSCNRCNDFLEANTDWGIENGFILSNFNELDNGLSISQHKV